MSAGISREEGSLASKQASKQTKASKTLWRFVSCRVGVPPPHPAAFLASALEAPAHLLPSLGDPSVPKDLPPFHTLLHASLDPGFLPLTTPFPSRSVGDGKVSGGCWSSSEGNGCTKLCPGKAQNSHLQREKLGHRERESWVNPESWNQWGRCSDVRLRASSSPSTLLLVSQLIPLSSPARTPSLLASLKVLHPFKKVSPAFTEVAN